MESFLPFIDLFKDVFKAAIVVLQDGVLRAVGKDKESRMFEIEGSN